MLLSTLTVQLWLLLIVVFSFLGVGTVCSAISHVVYWKYIYAPPADTKDLEISYLKDRLEREEFLSESFRKERDDLNIMLIDYIKQN